MSKSNIFSTATLVEEVKSQERLVWTLEVFNKNNVWAFLDYLIPMQRPYQSNLNQKVDRKQMLQIETLKQDIKSTVREKSEFEQRKICQN